MGKITLKSVRKSFGETHVIPGIDLDINDGEFVVFVGPSGCGKSTLLRLIAGLEDTSAGVIEIDGTDATALPPAKRGLAMVFQSYALYPHMTVRKNIAFPLKMAGLDQAEQDRRVTHAASILNLSSYLDRRPGQLSGGQRQRVAIGRAIVREPSAFLFDEPLSNLDAALRVSMRQEISELHQSLKTTMIYVTHDQVEAMTLADKIVVLRKGRVEQVGKPLELYHDPDNRFVAGFIGSPAMNFLAGRVEAAGQVSVPGLSASLQTQIALPGTGATVEAGLRPQHLRITDGNTHRVEMTEALGGVSFIHVTAPSGEKLVIEAKGDVIPSMGAQVGVAFDAENALFFDESGKRLR